LDDLERGKRGIRGIVMRDSKRLFLTGVLGFFCGWYSLFVDLNLSSPLLRTVLRAMAIYVIFMSIWSTYVAKHMRKNEQDAMEYINSQLNEPLPKAWK
jgi:hypothetical protein